MVKDSPVSGDHGSSDPEWGADFADDEQSETSEYEQTLSEAPLVGRKYRITGLLGQGGMGQVYLAKDRDLGRMVALKVLSEELSKDQTYAERLRREARAVASIGHPNIVQVFEIGETENDCPFLAMEMLDGLDLGEELEKHGKLSTTRAVDICGQVLFALSSAHRSGIVHRDLKPGNVFLTRRSAANWTDIQESSKEETEVVKILDFGISRFLDPISSSPKLTSTGVVMGTPYYMAPEQIRDMGSVDGRADLFAVGVILYECLTGRMPFTGDNIHSLLHHVLIEPASDPRLVEPSISEELASVMMRALEKDPSERYQNADEFIAALHPFHATELKDSWSGRPFLTDRSEGDSSLGGDKRTIALATGDLTPVAPTELMNTVSDPLPSDELARPSELAAEKKAIGQVDVPQLMPRRSNHRTRFVAFVGVGVLVVCLVVGIIVTTMGGGDGPDDVERSTIGAGLEGQGGETTLLIGKKLGLYPSRDADVSTEDVPLQGKSVIDGRPADQPPSTTDTTAKALDAARLCLGRRDRECCISALAEAPGTAVVKRMLGRCRQVDPNRSKLQRPTKPAPRKTGKAGKNSGSEVPVARDAPW